MPIQKISPSKSQSSNSKNFINIMKIIANLSFKFQNLNLNHSFLIFSLLATKTLLQTIFPSFVCISDKNSNSNKLEQFVNFFYFQLIKSQFSYHWQLMSLVQIAITSLFVVILFVIFKSKNIKFQSFALFVLTFIYYSSAILLIICTQILSKTLNNLITNDSSSQIVQHSSGNYSLALFLIFLTTLNILINLFFCFFYHIISHSYDINIRNFLCCRFSFKQIIIDLMIKLGIIINVFSQLNYPSETSDKIKIVYLLCQFVLVLYQLYNQLTFYRYNNSLMSNVYQKIIAIQISILLTTLLTFSTQLTLISQNYFFLASSLSIFIIITLHTYLKQNQDRIKLLTSDQIQNSKDAILYFINISKIIKYAGNGVNQQSQSFYLANLINWHQSQCINVSCICKTQLKKQQKYQKICNFLVTQIGNELSLIYRKEFQLLILILYQKLSTHKNFLHHDIYLNYLKNQLSWIQRLILQKYSLSIKNFIKMEQATSKIANTQKYSQFQKLQTQLQTKIDLITKLKIQFWSNIKKGNVVKQQFQIICKKQLKIMRECSSIKQIILKQFFHHSLISLLIAYEKFILLNFAPSHQLIEFSQRQKQLVNNPIFKLQKSQSLTIQKYLHSPFICCIETSLKNHNIGTIINAFNTQQTFGYPSQTLLNADISILMPKSMQSQHKLIMENWTKRCDWKNLGRFMEVFGIDKKGQSFSCNIYLKVIQRIGIGQDLSGGVNILGTLFKENCRDYMIVDEKGFIAGAGQVFTSSFTLNIVGIPLKIICPEADVLASQNVQKFNKVKRSSIFYSTNLSQNLLKSYHQRNNQFVDFNMEELIQKFRELQMAEPMHFVIQYQLLPYRMGNVTLILLKAISIEQKNNKLSLKNEICRSKSLEMQNECFYYQIDYEDQNNESERNNLRKRLISNQIMAQPSIGSSVQSTTSSFQANINHLQNIFYQGYKRTEKVINPKNDNNEEQSQEKQKNKKIYDLRIVIIVCSIIGLSGAGISVCSLKLYMNYNGFDEMQTLFFGDGACSDNMQLSMFIFNRALNIYDIVHKIQQIYYKNQAGDLLSKLQQQIDRKNEQFNYLHSLLTEQIHLINQQITNLTNTKIYAYQNVNTTWINSNGQNVTILAINLITNYLFYTDRLSKVGMDIINALKQDSQPANKVQKLLQQMKNHLIILQKNFDTLYQLNTQLLYYYSDLLLSNTDKIKLIGYLKFTSTFILIVSTLSIIYFNLKYRIDQLQKVYKIFRKIQTNVVEVLFVYFRKLQRFIKNQEPIIQKLKTLQNFQTSANLNNSQNQIYAKAMNNLHEQTLSYLQNPTKTQYFKSHLNFTLMNNFNNIISRLILFAIFVFICVLNILMVATQNNILNTTRKMMDDINGLMNSENHLIGSYYQVKGHYILNTYNKQKTKDQLKSVILNVYKDINVTEVQFNRVAIGSLQLFELYDSTYSQKMINILIDNVCQLINGSVSERQYNQCKKDNQMLVIRNGGVINGMNYFSRTLQQNFNRILSQPSNQFQAQLIFPIIDKTILPMFKIYQQTQAQITISLTTAINYQNIQYLLLVAFQILIFCGIIGSMVLFFKRQNQESVDRIGRILLLPVRAMKNNIAIMKDFQKLSDYRNLRFS